MTEVSGPKAYFHLPGLFEFCELYRLFLPLFYGHREYFYDRFEIGSVYGAPADCLWGGGRAGFGNDEPKEVFSLMAEYGISPRLTFSNSLLREEHLSDPKCLKLCSLLAETGNGGVIVHSELLLSRLRERFPSLSFISSTTKVITDFDDLLSELGREEFSCVVPDFRFNRDFDRLKDIPVPLRSRVEFLVNECCDIGCRERKACYENVSRKNLGEDCPDHICPYAAGRGGYRFSEAMKNPSFIGTDDILNIYLPMGFSNFKIEGRSLGSAVVLEFLLYYLTKPEYRLNVREEIYLDSSLDLF